MGPTHSPGGLCLPGQARRQSKADLVAWDQPSLMAMTLEQEAFRWPTFQDGVMRLTAAQLGALLEGLDWRRVQAAGVRPCRK